MRDLCEQRNVFPLIPRRKNKFGNRKEYFNEEQKKTFKKRCIVEQLNSKLKRGCKRLNKVVDRSRNSFLNFCYLALSKIIIDKFFSAKT